MEIAMTGLDSTSQCFEGIGICSFVSDPFEGINNFIYIYIVGAFCCCCRHCCFLLQPLRLRHCHQKETEFFGDQHYSLEVHKLPVYCNRIYKKM